MTGPAAAPARNRGRPGLAAALAAYNLFLLIASPILAVWLLWRTVVQRKGFGNPWHRLGLILRAPRSSTPRLWLHAVSAGEMGAMKPVADALRERLPEAHIVISTVTSTGMSVAQKTCGSADSLFYLPLDLLPTVALALWRLRPDLLVIAEKELWPNLLGLARLRGSAVLVVNGRLSDRMMRRAKLAPGLARWLHSLPHRFCVQSEQDAARLMELGLSASHLTVAGNTKVDTIAAPDRAAESRLRGALGVSDQEMWLVAGSTHPGEEEAVLEAFLLIRRSISAARLLLAPRHLERAGAVLQLLSASGLAAARRSQCPMGGVEPAAVVLDTMGELRAAYGFATVAFVGGTLVRIGGHNLLEPVAAGRAVLFGPHTENCADVAELVMAGGVGFRVRDSGELAGQFLRLANDERARRDIAERASTLIEQQRGAAQRCAEVAVKLLQERDG